MLALEAQSPRALLCDASPVALIRKSLFTANGRQQSKKKSNTSLNYNTKMWYSNVNFFLFINFLQKTINHFITFHVPSRKFGDVQTSVDNFSSHICMFCINAVITIAIRLRYDYESDYDPTTRLLPFDAIRREQKMNMSIFRRSRIVVVSYRNCDIGLRCEPWTNGR